MPEKLELDWSSAAVTDGKLTVKISERPPQKWRDSFDRTLGLLSHGKWKTALHPRKATVEIASVQMGEEERVRRLLEGAVLEANVTLCGEEALHDEQFDFVVPDDEPEQTTDEEITARFRAFAARAHAHS
jgi:hypothetical protein